MALFDRTRALRAALCCAALMLAACPLGWTAHPRCDVTADCDPGEWCVVGACEPADAESCTNDRDDDDDGAIDCADSDCASSCIEDCPSSDGSGDGLDNDEDGLVDCADPDCVAAWCPEICGDAIDNDADGSIDCADTACASASCPEICGNAHDDDADGLGDCADPDCLSTSCGEICDDGLDNDLDGAADCADIGCAYVCPETECGNGFDDDIDGSLDCADRDCAAACAALCGDGALGPTEQCDDGALAPGDGCDESCAVEPEAYCAALPALALGSNPGSTAQGATSAFGASCLAPNGPERAYTFTPTVDGTLQLTLESATDLGLHVVLGCGAFATEVTCTDAAPGGSPETLGLSLPAGAPITIFVDGGAPDDAGGYLLDAAFIASGS